MPEHYDCIVIGGGSAGFAAARTAREVVERVAIVDGAETLGGLCILKGCMPSKTLIYSAEVLHLAGQGGLFGIKTGRPQGDMAAVQSRKKAIIEDFARYRQQQLSSERFHLIRHRAAFSGPNQLTLDNGGEISADKIIIATGSEVAVPESVPGLGSVPFITSDDVLNLEAVPEAMIVLGGGVVACELAQFLARMGCRITMIQRSPFLLSGHSPDSAAVVRAAMLEEGMEVYTDTKIDSIDATENGVAVHFFQGDRLILREAPLLFNALGRRPAIGDLNLASAGVETLPSGHIRTNEFQQTSNPAVYATGDCAGPHEIVHLAILQGECAARHATGKPAEPVTDENLLSVVFTDPQVASVGLSWQDIRSKGAGVLSADFPFSDHGKSITMNATYGYVRLSADAVSGKILRAECVGKDAGELIHAMAVAKSLGASVRDLLRTPWYHPTLSEIWTYPLEEIAEQLPG